MGHRPEPFPTIIRLEKLGDCAAFAPGAFGMRTYPRIAMEVTRMRDSDATRVARPPIRLLPGGNRFRRASIQTALSIIRDQIENTKRSLDTVLAIHIGFRGPSRVHRRGTELHFIHEKEIQFKICLL